MSVHLFQAKTGEGMKIKKVRWDASQDEVVMWGWLGCDGKGKGRRKKHAFWRAARYTFIISRTLTRGRYGMIV